MRSLLLLLLMSGAALADDAALRRCRAMADASARLACYDALPLPATEAKPEPRASPRQLPATEAKPEARPSPRQTPEQFGLEQQPSRAELQTIESHIPGHFEGWKANSRIRLANGQIWQIADGSARMYSLDNPNVSIRRGALGSFFLDLENDNRSPRVRRVE